MKWLKLITTGLELIPVIGNLMTFFGWTKGQKESKKLKVVAKALINGVQTYRDSEMHINSEKIKEAIREAARTEGVYDLIDGYVQKYTKK